MRPSLRGNASADSRRTPSHRRAQGRRRCRPRRRARDRPRARARCRYPAAHPQPPARERSCRSRHRGARRRRRRYRSRACRSDPRPAPIPVLRVSRRIIAGRLECAEHVAVITLQPGLRANPEIARLVLQDRVDRVLRQTLSGADGLEVEIPAQRLRAGVCRRACSQQQQRETTRRCAGAASWIATGNPSSVASFQIPRGGQCRQSPTDAPRSIPARYNAAHALWLARMTRSALTYAELASRHRDAAARHGRQRSARLAHGLSVRRRQGRRRGMACRARDRAGREGRTCITRPCRGSTAIAARSSTIPISVSSRCCPTRMRRSSGAPTHWSNGAAAFSAASGFPARRSAVLSADANEVLRRSRPHRRLALRLR